MISMCQGQLFWEEDFMSTVAYVILGVILAVVIFKVLGVTL